MRRSHYKSYCCSILMSNWYNYSKRLQQNANKLLRQMSGMRRLFLLRVIQKRKTITISYKCQLLDGFLRDKNPLRKKIPSFYHAKYNLHESGTSCTSINCCCFRIYHFQLSEWSFHHSFSKPLQNKFKYKINILISK